MSQYIIAYTIHGVVAVDTKDEREAKAKMAELAEDLPGSVVTEITLVPMEYLP